MSLGALTQSKRATNIQWLLYCMVHNIEKIANLDSPEQKHRDKRGIEENDPVNF
jgi:hypothetical protein